ncbi:Potassium transporter KefB [Flavobacterium longum]|uniref:potassium transporter KefB n=1 Tax=Flavobacterium longum TaxID=1299340 RepID=UPI0039E7DFB8
MSSKNHFSFSRQERSKLVKNALLGAVIGLAFISLIIFNVGVPKPEWGTLWRIRPILVTSLAGAAGGIFFFFMNDFTARRGWNKVVVYALSFFVFTVGLWIGAILGLDGTLWN